MKCPFRLINTLAITKFNNESSLDCEGEKCAWWVVKDDGNIVKSGCAILAIAEGWSNEHS